MIHAPVGGIGSPHCMAERDSQIQAENQSSSAERAMPNTDRFRYNRFLEGW